MMSHVHSFKCTTAYNPQYRCAMYLSGRGCIHAAASATGVLAPCQILCTCTSKQQAGWDKLMRHSGMVRRLEGVPVLTDSLGHTEASQAFYSSKAVKATVLHPSKGQRLAHVRAAKVIDACHPRLNVTGTHTSCQRLMTSHEYITRAGMKQCEHNDCLSYST